MVYKKMKRNSFNIEKLYFFSVVINGKKTTAYYNSNVIPFGDLSWWKMILTFLCLLQVKFLYPLEVSGKNILSYVFRRVKKKTFAWYELNQLFI